MGRLRAFGLSVLLFAVIAFCAAETQVTQTDCSPAVTFPDISKLRVDRFSDVSENWKGATFLPDVGYTTSKGSISSALNFTRPLPNLLDELFLETFQNLFNKEQRMETRCGTEAGCNAFAPTDGPFVAVLQNAFVDYNGNVFDKETVHIARRETGTVPHAEGFWLPEKVTVVCIKKMATILQPYEDSYYHFVEEALPRLLLVRDAMYKDPEIRLLTRTKFPFILQFLGRLRIPLDRVVIATDDRSIVYHAEELYVPRPAPIFAPSQESLLAVHDAVVNTRVPMKAHVVSMQSIKHDVQPKTVVYVSRQGASSRSVVNEQDILNGINKYLNTYNKNREDKDKLSLVVFYGNLTVDETVNLFRRARVIIGPHGAGMANMLWASQPATVIEFLHSYDPLMVYWHTANALGLEYWMLPVPESYWGGDMMVPEDEAIEILHRSLNHHGKGKRDASFTICPEGYVMDETTFWCNPCPPGTFSTTYGMLSACAPCAPGRYNPDFGSTYCSTCPSNTFSNGEGATSCTSCSSDSITVLIGGTTGASCQSLPSQLANANPIMQGNQMANLNQRAAREVWPSLLQERKLRAANVQARVEPAMPTADPAFVASAPSVALVTPSASITTPRAPLVVPVATAAPTATTTTIITTPAPIIERPTMVTTMAPTIITTPAPVIERPTMVTTMAPSIITTPAPVIERPTMATTLAPTTPTTIPTLAPTTPTTAGGRGSEGVFIQATGIPGLPSINAVISVNGGVGGQQPAIPRPVPPTIPPINSIFTVPPPPATTTTTPSPITSGSAAFSGMPIGSEIISMGSNMELGSELLGNNMNPQQPIATGSGVSVILGNQPMINLPTFGAFNPVPVAVVSVGGPSFGPLPTAAVSTLPTTAAAPAAPIVETTLPTTTTATLATTTVATTPSIAYVATTTATTTTSPASRSTWFLSSLYDILF